jgi:hypothetical protein
VIDAATGLGRPLPDPIATGVGRGM